MRSKNVSRRFIDNFSNKKLVVKGNSNLLVSGINFVKLHVKSVTKKLFFLLSTRIGSGIIILHRS